MIRIFLTTFFLAFSFLTPTLFAQTNYYKVWFTNKQSIYDISRPAEFLSSKSIERRLLQQIPVSESDKPISPAYLTDIESTGAEIIYQSKWLNMVIVKSQQNADEIGLSSKVYVKSIESANHLFTRHTAVQEKPFFKQEKISRIPNSLLRKGVENRSTNDFNYGPSLNQAEMIRINQLHNMGFIGTGVTIGVIDAGFNSVNIHSAFDSLRMNGQILGTRDFVQPGNDLYASSMNSHGTMVLSTMGANLPGQLIGTAPGASYWLLRSEDGNAEYLMEEYYWVNAAEFADSVGVDVINSSLGYNFFDNPDEDHSYEDMDGNTTVITIAADMAAAKGILVVNSAGNSGGNSVWPYITAPADGDSVFTIGAVNSNGILAYFSSQGPTFDGRTKPEVVAQGVASIVADLPSGVGTNNGTSFSSPIIAGAAASLWQANPSFTNMQLIEAIKMSASNASNPDFFTGWGIPDFVTANNLLATQVIEVSNPMRNLKIFPNPFADQINITVDMPQSTKADVLLINAQGSMTVSLSGIQLAQGKNILVMDNLSKLPSGIYMLQITDGFYSVTQKIIR
ncbi:MAG: S8 family serine peptidase [Lentimicrobium sp.]|jgi:subtilisin family serine protease|nr:S8 family serine peptidase [Lentimicrobium sp.]